MHNTSLDWLDVLPDMRVAGVTGVTGVTPQKSVGFEVTPAADQGVTGCAAVTPITPAIPEGVTWKAAENCQITPVTPVTPKFDDGWGLLPETRAGLAWLSLAPPRGLATPQPLWAALVCDTVLFAKRGWAAKAMALGWSEMEIFGIASHGWQGVTSRLMGREVLGLDARKVAVQDARHVAQLPRETLAADAALIWEAGKR